MIEREKKILDIRKAMLFFLVTLLFPISLVQVSLHLSVTYYQFEESFFYLLKSGQTISTGFLQFCTEAAASI